MQAAVLGGLVLAGGVKLVLRYGWRRSVTAAKRRHRGEPPPITPCAIGHCLGILALPPQVSKH